MYVKSEKLKRLLNKLGWDTEAFADVLEVPESDVKKMLSGKPVGVHTARALIRYLRAEIAQHYIDWEKTGVKNPLEGANGNV